MNPLVSVIIPVYNSERYLKECLNTIVNQTLTNIEIICVDDGSTDNSLAILYDYAQRDDRFLVLKQNNLHAGVARNTGLVNAKSDYVIFLDSDDFFELTMLEEMYNKIVEDDSDVAVCGFYKYINESKIIKNRPVNKCFVEKSPFSPLDLDVDVFNFTNPAPWTKLFRKSVFLNNDIRFEDYISCNDLTCMILALACCTKISIVDKMFVYYRANQKTNITANRNKHVECVFYSLDKAQKELKRLGIYTQFEKAFLQLAHGSMRYELSLCSEDDKNKYLTVGKETLDKELCEILHFLTCHPKVSIIIPVYNNKRYLRQCLSSVRNQTLREIEVICVNDCSTDYSLELLKRYENLDNRIHVVNLEKNSGVSHARNVALEKISGDYVCFLDSDDFLELDFCEALVSDMENSKSDLSCGGHCKYNKFNQKISTWLPKKIVSTNLMNDINLLTKHRNVTQKLFKANIIKENKLKFDTTLHYMEDALFLVQYLTHCKTISGVDKSLYVVRINEHSLCRSVEFVERRKQESEKAKAYINDIISKYEQNRHL